MVWNKGIRKKKVISPVVQIQSWRPGELTPSNPGEERNVGNSSVMVLPRGKCQVLGFCFVFGGNKKQQTTH